jgi:ABC-type polysaccharide/polyol phosphate export permease
MFYITPIIWPADLLRSRQLSWVVDFNPFYHFLEIVRAPLLGNPIAWSTWIVVFLVTIGGFALLDFMQKRFARLVPLWI